MTVRFDQEALDNRTRHLGDLNAVKLVFVSLEPAPTPGFALLDVEFYNANHLSPLPPISRFEIAGGVRIKAGRNAGQVQVTEVQSSATPRTLRLKVAPVGDYSTYTLKLLVQNTDSDFDPRLGELPFKFRPGCFNLNCAPDGSVSPAPPSEPQIDYLARDYDSFRHVLITTLMHRVPNWQPTSEADLDQVLIDLLAADADQIADFQDRVMNEAYIGTARKRVSLARYARLMDYHIHEGNQASTWLAAQVSAIDTLPPEFGVWTHDKWDDPGSILFASESGQRCDPILNALLVYDWDGAVVALEAGSTDADLTIPGGMDQGAANALRDALLRDDTHHLLIQQELNPQTGTENGRDPTARQLLELLPLGGPVPRAESVKDPVSEPVTLSERWMVRVRWVARDSLQRRHCISTQCAGRVVTGVSKLYGNLLRVTQGRPHETKFVAPDTELPGADDSAFAGKDSALYETLTRQVGPEQKLCGTQLKLPKPLAFRSTLPGGDMAARSTLDVAVTASGITDSWAERIDLIDSSDGDRHFVVETDELGENSIRIGDGINGMALPSGAEITCRYRTGQGEIGNVGADRLVNCNKSGTAITRIWNPFDVIDGRAPEPQSEIIRSVPEAYRRRQKRAVTLADYAACAEEVTGVSHARARYAWTGSWRTVRVAIDPEGVTVLDPELLSRIEDHLNAVRLIGEDIEIRLAQFVPLDIKLKLCAHSRYWPENLRNALDMEFSDGYTPDGRRGFFHPDAWTFGQPLFASQIIGRVLSVTGIERVLTLSMRRWNPGRGGGLVVVTLTPDQMPAALVEKIDIGPFEIVQVMNDPSRLEAGRILFEIQGGPK